MTDTSFIIRDGKFVINSQKFVNRDTGCEDPGAGECFGTMDDYARLHIFRKLATSITVTIEDVDFSSVGGLVQDVSISAPEAFATDNTWWETDWFTKEVNADPTGTVTVWARIKFCFSGFHEPSGELYHSMDWKQCKFAFQIQFAPDSSGTPGGHFATFEGEAISDENQAIPGSTAVTFNELGVGEHAGSAQANISTCWSYSRDGNHTLAMVGRRGYIKDGILDPMVRGIEYLLVRLGSTVTYDVSIDLAVGTTSLNGTYEMDLIVPPGLGPELNDVIGWMGRVPAFISSIGDGGPEWALGGVQYGEVDGFRAEFRLNSPYDGGPIINVATNEKFVGPGYVSSYRDDQQRPDIFTYWPGSFFPWHIESVVPWPTDETYFGGEQRFINGGPACYTPPDGTSGYQLSDTPGGTFVDISFTQGSEVAAIEELPEAYEYTITDRLTDTVLATGKIYRPFFRELYPLEIWEGDRVRDNNYTNLDYDTGLVIDGGGDGADMIPLGAWRGEALAGKLAVGCWKIALWEPITPSATGVGINAFTIAPGSSDNSGPASSRLLPAETELDITFTAIGDPRG